MKSDLQWMQAQVVALRDVTPTVREFELRPDAGGFAAAPTSPAPTCRCR
jgi:ferredoxin-NADP reductase